MKIVCVKYVKFQARLGIETFVGADSCYCVQLIV